MHSTYCTPLLVRFAPLDFDVPDAHDYYYYMYVFCVHF